MVAMNGPKVDPETEAKIEAGDLDAGGVEVGAERNSVHAHCSGTEKDAKGTESDIFKVK